MITMDLSGRPHENQIYMLAVEAAPNAMIVINGEGQILSINSQAEKLFGYSQGELSGKQVEILVPDRYASRGVKLADFIRNPPRWLSRSKRRLYGLHKEGREIPIEVGISSIRTRKGAVLLAGITDISPRKQAEEQIKHLNQEMERRVKERTRKLKELSSVLIRAEHKERLRIAKILHDHLQQLLVAAKISLSRMPSPYSLEEASFKEYLSQTGKLLQESIDASRILTVELSPPVLRDAGLLRALEWLGRWMREKYHLTVVINSQAESLHPPEDICFFLFQSVRELLVNIARHAETREAYIQIQRQKNDLLIRISDHGKGFNIPPEGLEDKRSGGLFNIYERLEMLDGHMEIDSRPGGGTKVSLRIPGGAEAPGPGSSPGPAPRKKEEAHLSEGNKIRVLVVDDHKILREGIIRLLKENPKFEVVGEAANGEEAVSRAEELHPNVVVMDITMPKMNGIEATKHITTHDSKTRVIGLSLHDSEDMLKTMLDAGASAYLSKNGPIDALINTILEISPGAPGTPR